MPKKPVKKVKRKELKKKTVKKVSREQIQHKPKEVDIKIDKQKLKMFFYVVIGLILINLISTKKTYINNNLEIVTCRGLKFGEVCLGSKEIKESEVDINLPSLRFHSE